MALSLYLSLYLSPSKPLVPLKCIICEAKISMDSFYVYKRVRHNNFNDDDDNSNKNKKQRCCRRLTNITVNKTCGAQTTIFVFCYLLLLFLVLWEYAYDGLLV